MTEEGRGVDDGIPPPGPRQSLCWRKGARWEVSHRLCREDCHRQSEYWLLVPISKKNHHPTKVGLDPNPPPQQPAVVVASNPATLMHNKKPHTLAGTGLICCSRVVNGIRNVASAVTLFVYICNVNKFEIFCLKIYISPVWI